MNNEAIQFVRRRSSELFAGSTAKGRVVASNIAFAAAILGAEHVSINEDTDWSIVASEYDWKWPRLPSYSNYLEPFDRIIPFPEQGPTRHQPEIYAAASFIVRVTLVDLAHGPR